jgi:sec-independent protein translocase protein TatB
MFDVGFQEILVIGVIALLVFGPGKLPELGRMFGRLMREFRRASDEFRSTVETNLHINDLDPIVADPPPAPASTADASTLASPSPLASESEPAAESGASRPEGQGEATTDDNPEPFCFQRGSRIFHRKECAWVRRIPEVERVYVKQFAEAGDQALLACPVCEPRDVA